MKQFIVLIATVILGLFLFDLIAGPGDDSVYSSVRSLWINEIGQRTVRDANGP